MFGAARDPSRTFDELRQTYLGVLSKGATAGRFAPSPTTPPADVRHWQKHLIGRCAGYIERLERGLEPWSESDLDRYRLPHPLLGRLTVREMLLFTLYHYEHHKSNVVRRMGSSEGLPGHAVCGRSEGVGTSDIILRIRGHRGRNGNVSSDR
jgi:hypothetical protein